MQKTNLRFQTILTIFLILMSVLILIPFWLLVSVSFSNERDVIMQGYKFIPITFDLTAYKYIFQKPTMLINAYKVTIIFSVISTVLSVFLMALLAYPLTKKDLKGRSSINFYIYFTMLFSGGLVPTFILITKYLHLSDTIWVYILPGLISPWYVFMMRTFFAGLPNDIFESAYIDGAREYRIFLSILIPLSKPVLATVALFTFLSKWNDWFTSMLYINDQSLISLQYTLQRIMNNIKVLQENTDMLATQGITNMPSETVRMAMAVLVAGPALVVFPLFQKYFVQGLTVGSVKG